MRTRVVACNAPTARESGRFSMSDNAKLTAAIIAGLLMMAKGCGDVQPGPTPPTPSVTVKAAFDDYRSLMDQVWTEGADKSFATDREAFEWVKGRAELARKAAFAPVHQREQDAFGGPKWDDERRKLLWRQFAKECK
jgi:hypothetical protein